MLAADHDGPHPVDVITDQHVSDEEAFEILRRASQRMNLNLREVAERLVDRMGAVPSGGVGRRQALHRPIVRPKRRACEPGPGGCVPMALHAPEACSWPRRWHATKRSEMAGRRTPAARFAVTPARGTPRARCVHELERWQVNHHLAGGECRASQPQPSAPCATRAGAVRTPGRRRSIGR